MTATSTTNPSLKTTPATADRSTIDTLDTLVRDAGGDPDSVAGKRVRELMHTALKLLADEADDGEIKLLSRSIKELRYALKVFRPYAQNRKITIFGSARTLPHEPAYLAASDFAKRIADHGWMVITGAGDGIMRAGNGGAGKDKSFGVSIRLPFETNANDYIVGDPKLITFRYFFTRKLMFIWQAHAVALFAGGFGTQDECFEGLTLVQTGKAPLVPIVMVDAPGDDYWKRWDSYVRGELLPAGLIGEDDLNLYHITRDPADAVSYVREFYRNYHSQRFIKDTLLLRMHRPLKDEQVDAINEEFAVLVKEGRIEQTGALPGERDEAKGLPRLKFTFRMRGYGKLRAMIDRINTFDCENTGCPEPPPEAAAPPTPDLAEQTDTMGSDAATGK